MDDDCASGPYKRGSNPVWYFVDLVGIQCDDRCWLWVLQNQIPYQPATVYHNPNDTPWSNPIQFLANGTLPTDIYFDPNLTYRLEIRRNDGIAPPTQNDELLYLIENYTAGAGTGDAPGAVTTFPTSNQITNPQFSIMSVSDPFVLTSVTNPDPIEVAPGWFLDLVGTGNVTISRVALNSSVSNPTNAPYALRLQLSGTWTSPVVLRQRFSQAGNLWATEFVSTSYTARIEGSPQSVTTRIDSSDGAQVAVLSSDTLSNEFVEYSGVEQLPDAANLDVPPDAWIDYKMLLPTTADIYITSVQVVADNNDTEYLYEQQSIERQVDHMFHYYKPKLEYKPIPSYLVGWDFTMNPAQFPPTAPNVWGVYATGSNSSNYVWDQTIIYQNSDSGFTVGRTDVGAMRVTAQASNVRLALIQYLESPKAKQILNDRISVNVACLKALGNARQGIVTLYYTTAALPDMKVNDSIVDTLNADGSVNTLNGASWVPVPRAAGTAYFEIDNPTSQNFIDTMISGWDLEGITAIENVTFFAIVVGIEELSNGEAIDFHSISLCSGDIATRPAPKTAGEVLSDCERYYEKSYKEDIDPGTVTANNQHVYSMNSTIPYDIGGGTFHTLTINTGFTINFHTEKSNVAPVVSLYSPITGTVDRVNLRRLGSVASNEDINVTSWSAQVNTKCANYLQSAASIGTSYLTTGVNVPDQGSSSISLHYVADSRLGIV